MSEIFHALNDGDRDAMRDLRATIAKASKAAGAPKMTRETFDAMASQVPAPVNVHYTRDEVAGVQGIWCTPEAAGEGQLLYLHGGAYMFGSAHAFRHLAAQIAVRARMKTFVADYRLAPEHPFPAAIDDARAAARAMMERGPLAIGGDSAGGGLALALLAEGHGMRGVALSPWTDLALSGASMTSADDPILTPQVLRSGVESYLRGQDARDPRASPLYAQISNLPPVQIHVGTAEILLDDSRRFAPHCEVHVWEGMAHVFPRSIGMNAARAALDAIGTFLKEGAT